MSEYDQEVKTLWDQYGRWSQEGRKKYGYGKDEQLYYNCNRAKIVHVAPNTYEFYLHVDCHPDGNNWQYGKFRLTNNSNGFWIYHEDVYVDMKFNIGDEVIGWHGLLGVVEKLRYDRHFQTNWYEVRISKYPQSRLWGYGEGGLISKSEWMAKNAKYGETFEEAVDRLTLECLQHRRHKDMTEQGYMFADGGGI